MSTSIKKVTAYEVLDSRGQPTVACQVAYASGAIGYAAVPSGASTGEHEAHELRDGDSNRYGGKGVLTACKNIAEVLAPALIGQDGLQQSAIDKLLLQLDGSDNKENLGANALLAVSLANAKAAAAAQDLPLFASLTANSNNDSYTLPLPLMNIINGGAHADNNVDFQEFMICPVGAATMHDAVRWGSEVYMALKAVLKKDGLSTAVGDEGGFAPNLRANEQACTMIIEAIEQAGFTPGTDIALALDVASSEIYKDGKYYLSSENKQLSAEELVAYYADWVQRYPIISIEDGMDENDWDGWALLTKQLGDKVQLVGDDLFVTNPKILTRGINDNIANAILIKPNQIGTLTETLAAISLAQQHKYGAVISHRSGETEDTTIADIAVATAVGQIKTGAPCRSDRTAKYNRLMYIEHLLGAKAQYAGASTVCGHK